MGHKFGVSRIQRRDGLAMFWKQDIDLKVVDSSPKFIDAIVNAGKENSWHFTGFYGALETQNHHQFWSYLQRPLQKFSLPWICAGNFNEIIRSHEKVGGRIRPYRQMHDFRQVLDECGLADLGFVGNKITWSEHYPDGHTGWERLDRAIGTSAWLLMFPTSKVIHLECGSSDHKSIIIHPNGIPIQKQKPWHFEQVWLSEIGCIQVPKKITVLERIMLWKHHKNLE